MVSVRSASNLAKATTRSFSSTSAPLAPPKPAKTPNKKPQLWQLKKGSAAEEDGAAAGGSGGGSVLSEVTQPKLDLSYIQTLQPEGLTPEIVGQVRAFSPNAIAAFKALSIPPTIQKEFEFTPRPATVVRAATLKTAQIIDQSRTKSSKDSRHVLTGPTGSGKSVLLLQTLSYAQSTGYVVLYLPSATPLTNSSTPHLYSTDRALFDQPVLARSLLAKFTGANAEAFKALKTAKAYTFGDRQVKAGVTLTDLATKGVDDKSAPLVLEAVFDELAAQTTRPVLLALDEAQSLFTTSDYVDPSYSPLESFSLAVPRLLLSYVSGAKAFAHGAVVLAPSLLSKKQSPAMTLFLSGADKPAPFTDVGSEFATYQATLGGASRVEVPARLERREAVGVIEMLRGARGIREPVSDRGFLERYVASDGNARQLSRALGANVRL